MGSWHSVRNRHFILSDVLLIPLAAYASFVLRLDHFDLQSWWMSYLLFSVVAVTATAGTFWLIEVYARFWRYASVRDLLRLAFGIGFASVVTGSIALLLSTHASGYFPIPRTVPVIFLFLALTVTALPRLLLRAIGAAQFRADAHGTARIPTFIIGAGNAAAMLLRELQQNPQYGVDVVGLIDDDPLKHHIYLHGARVLGSTQQLAELAAHHNVRQVIIAIPSASGRTIREMVNRCETIGLTTRILPSINEMLGQPVQINQLREVRIEDLLRRDPIQIDTAEVGALLSGQRVLVTGASGSIGSELCRQIALFKPALLTLLDHSENGIFHIRNELEDRFPDLEISAYIGDIRDPLRIESILRATEPTVIFHAAAQKHVPLMEENPCEAIRTNVRGTQVVVELAERLGVERFVMVSTDKAVNPTNVMGASKRCAELLVQAAARRCKRPYVAVRFGNVLGSNGSVVPRFQQQIAAGGPVTVTHAEMRRFFMTIPEAVLLVLQAGTIGSNGEVYVLDMGEPVRIADLAEDLIRLHGLEPHEEIEIAYTGPRPGEKLFEELFIKGEEYDRTRHNKVFRVRSATEERGDVQLALKVSSLVHAAEQQHDERIRPLLQSIVREYEPAPALPIDFPLVLPHERVPEVAV